VSCACSCIIAQRSLSRLRRITAGVGGPEAQDRLMMQLFKAYFTQVCSVRAGLLHEVKLTSSECDIAVSLQAQFINDTEVLVEAAAAAGFNADEARAVVADPAKYRSEVSTYHACIWLLWHLKWLPKIGSACAHRGHQCAGKPGAEAGSRPCDRRTLLRLQQGSGRSGGAHQRCSGGRISLTSAWLSISDSA